VTFLAGAAGASEEVLRLVQMVPSIAGLILAFRVAGILRSDFARSGRFIEISSLGVFFLNFLYLQHKMNVAADTPARLPKGKQKRKPESVSG
jgi:hypothetical protein